MSAYRKKPVVIDAEQWDGVSFEKYDGRPDFFKSDQGTLCIITLEGPLTVSPGDYIIRGVKGEYYPCKPDVFEQTYEPA